MRKTAACLITLAALAGPFAAAASADPVRDLSCSVQKKLGVDNVQECNF